MSRPVATGRGASDMTATPQCDESESHPSASQAHHPTPRSDRALWQQILRIPSRFFSVSIFAARIPLVSADAGDDFSNNLLSDLAPIMALFGEKVAIQYMSQSMDWVEDLIFATAPLGIITAIVGAIRVGGPTWMKAVIGRAREGKGVVEVELMSSTSSDVCELWNGDGVVRVMGSSPIIELLYVEVPSVNPLHIDPPEEFQDSDSLDGWQEDNDQDHLLEVHHPTGIYDFKSAKDTILQNESLKEAQESDNSDAPNIALNIGGERVSDPELNIVAIIGIWLQLGVIVFAGFSVLYSPWAGKFQKNDKNVQLYAFPAMAAGTVALVVGMFICARIIERSTSETKWVIKRRYHNVKVAWVQKSGVVNDQQFNSYFIRRSSEVPKSLTRWLRTDTQPQIMTSRKREGLQQTSLTTAATFLSLLGFAAQFVGLRGMNWSVTIAQLMAVAIMTVLRALVRRNLVSNVQQQPIETGYELDFVAAQIKNCSHWNAVTWGVDRSEDFRSNGLASKVLDARCRLGELSKWECQWQKTVDSTIEAIEATINFLSTHSDVTLSGLYSLFEWELVIEVSTAQGNRVFETVQLSMAREWLSEGRGWGYWKVDKSRIEAILGLWMSHIKHSEGRKSSLVHRIVDVDKETYEQWVRRQEQTTTKIHCGELIIGKPSTALPSRDGHFHMLAVLSGAPLDSICGQAILSAFISKVAETVLGEIGGRVGVRGGTGVKASFGLRNQVLDELANKVEQTGLASIEDAFLSIIPPLQKAGKLSTITLTTVETSLNLTKEINLYIEGGRFDQAEPLLLWLLDVAETSANSHKTEKRWGEAWGVYLALLDTYSGIKGGEDYRNKAEETMGLFCEMMFMSFEWTSDRSLRDLVSDALGGQRQELWESSLQQWEFKLQNWGKDKINLPTTDQILAERLLQASTDGNCLDVARLSTQISDLNTQDSLGRTPLILASILGYTTIVAHLLERYANPHIQDLDGRTAMHHASMRGHTLIIRVLLHHVYSDKSTDSKNIDIRDKDGKFPLDLAVENNDGIAVVFLIFNGAKDPNDRSKKLLQASARKGSFAIVKTLKTGQAVNLKDLDGRTPLHWSIWRDSSEALRLLLNGTGIGGQADVQAKDNSGQTALHYGARKGRTQVIELLISKGADINARDLDKSTPLHYAARNGHQASIQLLHSRGADIESEDIIGRTALSVAALNGNLESVRILLDYGASIEAKDKNGWTALRVVAARSRNDTIVRLLLDRGADINAKDNIGWTALISAAYRGDEATVKLLLDHHADIEAKNGFGSRALHSAALDGHEVTVQLLLDRGADIEARNNNGWTALHSAVSSGHEAIVRLLMIRGADLQAQDDSGWTALCFAVSNEHHEIARLLHEHTNLDSQTTTNLAAAAVGNQQPTVRSHSP